MIPKVAGRGHSFKGLARYLTDNSKEMEPDAPSRVAWTETVNLLTDDIEKAARVMAWTDLHANDLKQSVGISAAGAKPSAGAVYHYSLSWAQGESPDPAHMKEAAAETIKSLGLSEHEHFFVAHNDRKHSHVHIVVNLTHPEKGTRAEIGRDYVSLQKWALKYERKNGLKCEVREKNAQDRAEGKKVKYRGQKQDYSTKVTRAFSLSDDAKSFKSALEMEGLYLAKSRRGKGFTVVDEKGWIQDLARQLDIDEKGRSKTKAINKKLEGLDRDLLPDADELSGKLKQYNKEQKEAIFQDNRRAFITSKRVGKAEKLFVNNISSVERQQTKDLIRQEQQFTQIYKPRIEAITQEARGLQEKIEGAGIRLALRRVWRGKKDKEQLGNLRHQVDELKREMERERQQLAALHSKERADLQALHAEKIENILRAEKSIPDYVRETKDRGQKKPLLTNDLRLVSTGPRVAKETADKRRAEYIRGAAYKMREAEEVKARAASIARETERLRPNYEKRQREIKEQDYAAKRAVSEEQRKRAIIEAAKQYQKDTNKDKGFER